MAKTPEKKVKEKVTSVLKSIGAYYFYPVSGGYGRSGVPDIIGCYQGKFFGIECKAGAGKLPTVPPKTFQDDFVLTLIGRQLCREVSPISSARL